MRTYETYVLPKYIKDWLGSRPVMRKTGPNKFLIAGDRNGVVLIADNAADARARLKKYVAFWLEQQGDSDKRRKL